MIHLLSITRWNRGYRRVLAGIRPSVSELVISRRDKRIVSECFKTPHEFPGVPKGIKMAEPTGLEPATSHVTGERSNQLNYGSAYCVNSGWIST